MRYLSLSKGVFAYIMTEYMDITLKKICDLLKINSTNAIYKLKEKGREYGENKGSFTIIE
ncbi:hypothetical protein BVX93_01285 [bacterium B13(2017)]|nr:hypothetical protein BVX93_01285 [bacterium B13(2017)]